MLGFSKSFASAPMFRLAIVAITLFLAVFSFLMWRAWRHSPPTVDRLPLLIVPFRHVVVDPSLLTGIDCCTDVLAIGDINGDGRPDIVLGAQESKEAGLVWYENPTWQRHAVARGEFTTDGKIADLDGDGDGDIIIGEFQTGLTWYENLDKGVEWRPHLIGAGYVHDIVIGDLDGDKRPEIVTCDKKQLALWHQSSAGWTRTDLLSTKGEGIALTDMDGDSDPDIVLGGRWLENPGPGGGGWPIHVISPAWPADTRVRVADMNCDGRLDVVLTASEGPGRVSWFERPSAVDAVWQEHRISGTELEGAHSLIVTDFDGDGDPDVLVAEMHTSRKKRILIFINDGGDLWRSQMLAATGSHNMQAADLDGDGDVDIVGKNYAGPGRSLELWENLTRDNFGGMSPSAAPFVAQGWQYVAIDERRDDDQRGKMGLIGVDANRDGRLDLVAGSFLYLNPGPDLAQHWTRVRLGRDLDVFFSIDVDGDQSPDLIGARRNSLLWLKAADGETHVWREQVIGEVPDARTQGYTTAQIEAGGRAELVFTRGTTLSYVRVPDNPESGPWPRIVVSTETEEEGVAAADIDRDGILDLVATKKGGHEVMWFKNPGTPGNQWKGYSTGTSGAEGKWLDRVSVADINQDGRIDVIVSEETQDWTYNASIYWFEAPKDPRVDEWRRRRIGVLRSVNSLDVRDMDGDGLQDVIVAEHTDMRESAGAPNNLTVVFANVGRGAAWRPFPVEAGPHSSHLGARVFDLDADGRPDIVSLGWNQFRKLHLWWRR